MLSEIETAIDALKNDAVYVLPTETVYGLFTQTNIEAIYSIKQRPNSLKLAYYTNEIPDWLLKHVKWPLLKQYIPGPIAVIYNGQCYRFSSNPILRAILNKVKYLYGTSANIHTQPSCTNCNMLSINVAYINDGNTFYGYETTIIDLNENYIVRHGVIDMRSYFEHTPLVELNNAALSNTVFSALLNKHHNKFYYFYDYLHYYGSNKEIYLQPIECYETLVLNKYLNSLNN